MKEVASLFETYKNAIFRKDVEAFMSIFDEKVQVFDMWHWSYEGSAPWRKMADGWFSSLGTESVVVSFDDIQIVEKGDMAMASAYVKYAAIDGNGQELRSMQNRLSWVALKKDGYWKVIHEHSSGPIDGATMKVVLQRDLGV